MLPAARQGGPQQHLQVSRGSRQQQQGLHTIRFSSMTPFHKLLLKFYEVFGALSSMADGKARSELRLAELFCALTPTSKACRVKRDHATCFRFLILCMSLSRNR